MKDYLATIVKNEKIAENVYAVTFALAEDICVRAGQFGNIAVGGTHLLRRPIAICKSTKNRIIKWVYPNGEKKSTAKAWDGTMPVWYSDFEGKNEDKTDSI